MMAKKSMQTEARKRGDSWRALRHYNYRILYPANALSNIGTWAQRIAQDLSLIHI
jgi:hypothetical protein